MAGHPGSLCASMALVVVLFAALFGVACSGAGSASVATVAGGDASRGVQRLTAYGCGSCHVIPGVRDANGAAAPALASFAFRNLIAGELTNTPEHLISWIMDPPSIEPGTTMPNLGVKVADARDMAAYLYTLR
jgi:cytochrome c